MKTKQFPLLLILIFLIQYTKSSDYCSSYFEGYLKNYCSELKSDDTSLNCDYSNNECTPKKVKCDSYKGTDTSVCESYTPTDTLKKCKMIGSQCTEVSKTCSDYIKGTTLCYQLDPEDTNKICVLKNNQCQAVAKSCKDFASDEKDSYICSLLSTSDGNNQKCVFSSKTNNCKEIYNNCDLYNDNIVKADRKKDDCEEISYFDFQDTTNSYKCYFEGDTCKKKIKDCSELESSNYCYYQNLEDTHKACYYINGECKEDYKSCPDYNEVENKRDSDCKSIKVYSSKSQIDYTKICEFDSEKKTCQEKALSKCEDYISGMDPRYCYNIPLKKPNKQCSMKDNNCVEIYINCPGDSEDITEEVCKNIIPSDGYKKCVFENGKCKESVKECSEYKGSYSSQCQHCSTGKANQKCFMENGQCVAKYYECESYEGNDKSICESIIPENYGSNYKCILNNNNKCVHTRKDCQDAKKYDECLSLNIDSNKENCAFIDGECKKQFKDCAPFNGESQDRNLCESIILLSNYKRKCVFSSTDNTCSEVDKKCSDFKPNDYSLLCPMGSPSFEKTCSFSEGVCSEVNKSCLELAQETSVTESICSNAPTSNSNNKQCVINDMKTGCKEVDKDNKSSFGLDTKRVMLNLLIIIIGLLL